MKIRLKYDEDFAPQYMTEFSAGCDLKAAHSKLLHPGKVALIKTGVYIDEVDGRELGALVIPELQIRARSSLAYKHGIMLANGVGTIDIDYEDEIGVLLYNAGPNSIEIKAGDRIAQLVVGFCHQIEELKTEKKRRGGFGSTDA